MKLLIYGASGFAKEVYDLSIRNYPNRWDKVFFIDDFVDEGKKSFGETVKFSTVEKWLANGDKEYQGVVAVGEPVNRKILMKKFVNNGIEVVNIIDKTAIISPSASLGNGVIVCEMAAIHSDVVIGNGVLIQPQAIIGHDIKIGDYCVFGAHCSPGGECVFGAFSYVGMNSTIKEKLSIGEGAIISMGSVVYKDVEDWSTVIGNPARVTRGNDEHKVYIN